MRRLAHFVVFDDGDGVQETGELGVKDVLVTLDGAGADNVFGTSDDTVQYDPDPPTADGRYIFNGLSAGKYKAATFSNLPAGFEFTAANQGSDTLDCRTPILRRAKRRL